MWVNLTLLVQNRKKMPSKFFFLKKKKGIQCMTTKFLIRREINEIKFSEVFVSFGKRVKIYIN